MAEYIQHEGRKYWLQSSGRYFQSGVKTDDERLLHRRIWTDEHGPIPEGHHVHHINGNWRDNDLSNLECVRGVEHMRSHMLERNATDEGYAASLDALRRGRPLAAEWHASAEGIAWHREHGAKTMEARPLVTLQCESCNGHFETKAPDHARYCSRACAQQVAFRRYFDDPRTCVHCGEGFTANRHRATQFCSRTCSNRHRAASRKAA